MIRTVKRSLPALIVVCGVVALAGCKSDGSEPATTSGVAMGAINDKCPIMGGDVDPTATMADFDGTKIGFCCDGCINKWNTWSYAQKKQFVAKYQ